MFSRTLSRWTVATLCGCALVSGCITPETWSHRGDTTALASQVIRAPEISPQSDPATPASVARVNFSDGVEASVGLLPLELLEEPPAPRDANHRITQERWIDDQEMLAWALSNSPVLRPLGIRVIDQPQSATTIYDRAITASDPFYGPQAALAEFDSRLSASLDQQNNDRVFNNATLGGDVQELVQDHAQWSTGWQKRTLSGGVVSLHGSTLYDNNNRQANIFPNYWEQQVEASVRQPLLRGAGRNFNLIAGPSAQPGFYFSNGIVIARLNTRISDSEFEIALRRFVRDLYTTYWGLAGRYENYQRVREATEVAHQTWQAALAKREAGLAGGETYREAEARAKYHRYQRELLLALGGPEGVFVTERRLRQQMGLPIVDGELLRPRTDPIDAPIHYDYAALVADGLTQRSEMRRQRLRVQQQQLKLVAAKNFLLPQMDLIGRYRVRGFGDDLYGDGPRFASAGQDLFSLDHQEWQFGVEMGVAAGRRQAHAAVQHASLQLQRERAVLREQQREIQHEISDAVAAVASGYAALQASQAHVEASRERLASSRALFESEKLQIEFLLDAQEELLQAEQLWISDRTQYAIAIVQVSAATGRLLQETGVDASRCWESSDAVN